jgi:putative phosphoribosyl transferase
MKREEMGSRQAAGQALVAQLRPYAAPDVVVLGVSRGGILVGLEVAGALGAPFEALAVRVIVDPQQPEHTAGVVVEPDYVEMSSPAGTLDQPDAAAEALEDVRRRGDLYRGGRERRDVAGRRVIVVSDAASTGMTLRGVVAATRARGAREVIVALPVAPPGVFAALHDLADGVIGLDVPADLIARKVHYPTPLELDDEEIARLVRQFEQPAPPAP